MVKKFASRLGELFGEGRGFLWRLRMGMSSNGLRGRMADIFSLSFPNHCSRKINCRVFDVEIEGFKDTCILRGKERQKIKWRGNIWLCQEKSFGKESSKFFLEKFGWFFSTLTKSSLKIRIYQAKSQLQRSRSLRVFTSYAFYSFQYH